MRPWKFCLAALIALTYCSASDACDRGDCGCNQRGHRPIFGHYGVRHCANCDDAPVVVGGPGIPCGGDCGSCQKECGSRCGGKCHQGGLICNLFGWIGQCGKCSGCGPKYVPEWHSKPCEPCNRCGDWTGPSIHQSKPYLGPPRSGSNIGQAVPTEPKEVMPAKPQPKTTIFPERSVRSIKRASHFSPLAPRQMPRHRRAAPQTSRAAPQVIRTVRVQAASPRTSSQPFRGIVIE